MRLSEQSQEGFERGPTWSPDGNWIAYFTLRSGKHSLLKARVGGAAPPVVLGEVAGSFPRWSPKGDWIAFRGSSGIHLVSADGHHVRPFSKERWLTYGWSKDGAELCGIRKTKDRRLVLAALNAANGQERTISELGRYPAAFAYGDVTGWPPLDSFALSRDGKAFVTSVIRAESDLWTLENFQKPSGFWQRFTFR